LVRSLTGIVLAQMSHLSIWKRRRSAEREDLSPYVAPGYPYRYSHLRSFDESGLCLLFSRVFHCEFVETYYAFACYDVIRLFT